MIMRTKIIFNESPGQVTLTKGAQAEVQKIILLMLKEKGFLTQRQYEESLKIINKRGG